MRISDWSSDVCSSDLDNELDLQSSRLSIWHTAWMLDQGSRGNLESSMSKVFVSEAVWRVVDRCVQMLGGQGVTSETIVMRIRSEEHTSELQSLMRISYAVFCLKKNKQTCQHYTTSIRKHNNICKIHDKE